MVSQIILRVLELTFHRNIKSFEYDIHLIWTLKSWILVEILEKFVNDEMKKIDVYAFDISLHDAVRDDKR